MHLPRLRLTLRRLMLVVAVVALDCSLLAVFRRKPLGRHSRLPEAVVIISFDVAIALALLMARRLGHTRPGGREAIVSMLLASLVAFLVWGLLTILSQP